ncbi:hypothetical protein IMSAGC011_03626 [Lachnospiraceae bacterium]|nr:hypothetical protein IMSAGC011_03626 [Lachnospiraceae bacterium]
MLIIFYLFELAFHLLINRVFCNYKKIYLKKEVHIKMKIWKLRLDAGKREDSQQYQLVNDDNHFLEDFDTMINSLERQLWKLRELEVHVISGRKEFDISYLWNGTSLFLLNERAKNILEPVLSEYVEFLPVIYKKPLYLMHVLRVADALNLDNAIRSKKASYSRIYGA